MNKIFLALFGILFFSLVLISQVLAIGGSVSPSRLILSGDIGKTFQRSITVYNTGNAAVNVTATADGTNIILRENKFSIEPNSNYTIPVNITINKLGADERKIKFTLREYGGSVIDLYTTISLNGTSGSSANIPNNTNATNEGTGNFEDFQITTMLSPETPDAISGKEVNIKSVIKNTGTTVTDYIISVYGNEDWSSLLSVTPQILSLSPNSSGESIIKLKINENIKGLKEFIIKIDYDNLSREQSVKINVIKNSFLADIAYIVKDSTHPDYNIINAINELGYSYELIKGTDVSKTNFSDYKMILIGNERIYNIPVNDYRSLIANPDYYKTWSSFKGSTTKNTAYNYNQDISITNGIPKQFRPYTQTSALYYLYGRKYSTNPVITTGNSTSDLGKYVVAVKDNPRRIFFGITKTQYWTSESMELFKNSVKWIIEGEDKDNDGYYTDYDCNDNNANVWRYMNGYIDNDKDGFGSGNLMDICSGETLPEGYSLSGGDCNDNNPAINPNAGEIPYNNVDENCNGLDLTDFDKDGYNINDDCNDNNSSIWMNSLSYTDNDKDGFGAGNLINLCIGEIFPDAYSLVSGDCNDNNPAINPNAGEIMDNIDQNCKNDAPVMIGNINDLEWNEDEFYPGVIDLKNYIKDYDGDNLVFSIYNISEPENFIIGINKGIVDFTSKKDWSGEGWVIFKGEDNGGLHSLTNNIDLKVNAVNDAPEILNKDNLKAELNEDFGNYDFDLSSFKYDKENNDLDWVVEYVSGKFNATVDNNILKLSSFQDENCLEACGVMLRLIDSGNMHDRAFFNVIINPVNDVPVLKKEIENQEWKQNANLTLNLENYFYDADEDKLSYSFSGNSKINIEINNDVIKFIPEYDWNGTETVLLTAYDSEYNISSNPFELKVLYVDKPPRFGELNCSREILEDESYSCELAASDAENDTFEFSVAGKRNLNCTVEGNVLSYIGYKDYFGDASCILRVADKDGYEDYTFDVNIENTNDAPVINSFTPAINFAKVFNSTNRIFTIRASDIDSDDIAISWLLGNENVANGSSYIFNKPAGNYNLTAIVSDMELSNKNFWGIYVGLENDFSCSELNGKVCSGNQICPGEILKVYDSLSCCSVACIDKPPEFKEIKRRKNITGNVNVEIRNINSGREFKTGDIIPVELNIENNADKELSFDVDVYLYDITKEDIVKKTESSVKIDKMSNQVISLDIEVPREADENRDYSIFSMIYAKKGDKEYYGEKYVKIDINRKEHDIVFDGFEINLKDIVCGDNMQVKVNVKNIGRIEEHAYIKLENSALKINQKSDDFTIEEYRSENDEDEEVFNIAIPEKSSAGNYTIKATVFFNNDNSYSEEKDIVLGECKEQQVETSVVENSPIITLKSALKIEKKTPPKIQVFLLSTIFTLIIFVLVLLMVKVYNNSETGIEKRIDTAGRNAYFKKRAGKKKYSK